MRRREREEADGGTLLKRPDHVTDGSPRTRWLLSLQRAIGNSSVAQFVIQRQFTSVASRNSHFAKHGAEFPGLRNATQYENAANTLWANRASYSSKANRADGKIYVFNAATGTFGAFTTGGKCITMFKPNSGASYYNRQPSN